MKKIIVLIVFCFSILYTEAQDCGSRYYESVFTSVRTNNIQYGRNVKFNGDTVDLFMDIYEPENDTLENRPLMMLAFGGSFTSGIRQSPDIVRLCTEFSQRGYVCVSIDYRIGFENGIDSDTNQFKALIRGVQDMKGALRYFYKDAQTLNEWKIDTNMIFAGGVSAGAFMGLNMAYGKTNIFSRVIPAWAFDALAEVGGTEGVSGNPGYSWNVKGVINLCGAMTDTILLQHNDPMLVSVHGTEDDLVPYYYDSVLAATQVEAMLFGSGDIHRRAEGIGLTNTLKTFYDAGHVPFILPTNNNILSIAKYMDTTIWTIRDFLYDNVFCNNDTASSVANIYGSGRIAIYPNPAQSKLNIAIDDDVQHNLLFTLYNYEGREIINTELINGNNTVAINNLISGIYFAAIRDVHSGNIVRREKLLIE
jgi:predicted esterase